MIYVISNVIEVRPEVKNSLFLNPAFLFFFLCCVFIMKYIGTSHAHVVVYDHRLVLRVVNENLELQSLIHYGKTMVSTWAFLALAMALLLKLFVFFYCPVRLCSFEHLF